MDKLAITRVDDLSTLQPASSVSELMNAQHDSCYRRGMMLGARKTGTTKEFPEDYYTIHNAYVIFDRGGNILLLDQNLRLIEPFYPKPFWYRTFLYNNDFFNFSRDELELATFVPGCHVIQSNTALAENLFHKIVDNYTRLFYYHRFFDDTNIPVAFPICNPMSEEDLEIHNFLTNGIPLVFFEPGIFRFEKLLVLPSSFNDEYLMIEAFKDVRARIKRKYVKGNFHHKSRLFISRSDTNVRSIANETELVSQLQSLGFTPITPGDFSMRAQFELFASAEIVVGVHGMGFAPIVALPEDCLGVYELEAQNWSLTGYSAMCAAMDIPHGFLPCELVEMRDFGAFNWVGRTDIEKSIKLIAAILDGSLTNEQKSQLLR
jgi:hypothetical protein